MTAAEPLIKKKSPVFNMNKFIGEINSPEIPERGAAYEKFQKSMLDQTKDYPLPVSVIDIVQNDQRIPFLTLKSLSLWQGKQKSKKTTALAIAVSSFISPSRFDTGIHFASNIEGVVIFFDTEQGESYAARTMRLILKLAGLDKSPRLIYCDLREFSPKERLEIIKSGIEHTPDVKLVVIDGLVDLQNDFMDASEGHVTTTEILKLCSQYDIHVAGVLHQNKNDKNARAHIGTISSQKCEMEISTEVDPNNRSQSQIVCVNSRGLPFEPFSIKWEKGSLPCINQEWSETKASDAKANKRYEEMKEIAEGIFKPLKAISHAQAIQELMMTTGKSGSTAKRILGDFKNWGFVEIGDDGKYRRNGVLGSRVHEGSKEGS